LIHRFGTPAETKPPSPCASQDSRPATSGIWMVSRGKLSAKMIYFDQLDLHTGGLTSWRDVRQIQRYTEQTAFALCLRKMIHSGGFLPCSLLAGAVVWDRFPQTHWRSRGGGDFSREFFFLVEIFNLLVILSADSASFLRRRTLLSVPLRRRSPTLKGLFFLCLYFMAHALWKVWRSPTSSLAVPEAALGIYCGSV